MSTDDRPTPNFSELLYCDEHDVFECPDCQFSEPHYCDKHDVFECPDCNPPEKEEDR